MEGDANGSRGWGRVLSVLSHPTQVCVKTLLITALPSMDQLGAVGSHWAVNMRY